MRIPLLHKTVLSTLIMCLSSLSYADLTHQENQQFQADCVKAWMERAGNVSSKVDFKDFGEKYCACGATKPLDTKDDISHTAQICMSETLLHVAMDGLEDQEGLANVTQEKIEKSCQDVWTGIYPDMDTDKKSSIDTYCQCASPKLMNLNKDREKVTDKQWYEKINAIADECANNVEADKATTNLKKESSSE